MHKFYKCLINYKLKTANQVVLLDVFCDLIIISNFNSISIEHIVINQKPHKEYAQVNQISNKTTLQKNTSEGSLWLRTQSASSRSGLSGRAGTEQWAKQRAATAVRRRSAGRRAGVARSWKTPGASGSARCDPNCPLHSSRVHSADTGTEPVQLLKKRKRWRRRENVFCDFGV